MVYEWGIKSTNWQWSFAFPWNVWEECDPALGDHFIWSRFWVSCRFCWMSFCHFYPPCAPDKKIVVEMGEKNPGGVRDCLLLEIMAKLMKMRGGRHTSKLRLSMLFVVLPRWRSPGLSPRVPFSQRLSHKNDWRDRLCLKVLLIPLDLRNVSLQISKLTINLLFRSSCRAVIYFC